MGEIEKLIEAIPEAHRGAVWHKLGEMLHKSGGVHAADDDGGDSGPVSPPPAPPPHQGRDPG